MCKATVQSHKFWHHSKGLDNVFFLIFIFFNSFIFILFLLIYLFIFSFLSFACFCFMAVDFVFTVCWPIFFPIYLMRSFHFIKGGVRFNLVLVGK